MSIHSGPSSSSESATQQVIDCWNATAGSFNQWKDLGGDQRLELFLKSARLEERNLVLIAFSNSEPDAHPQILAEEAFDMKRAAQAHIDDPTFSLNTVYAVLLGDKIAVPVDGDWRLTEIQELAPRTTLFEISESMS